MEHLSFEKIVDFVSYNKITPETERLSATVNGHIARCEECRKLVTAVQDVYDEFCRIAENKGVENGYTVLSKNDFIKYLDEGYRKLLASDNSDETEKDLEKNNFSL